MYELKWYHVTKYTLYTPHFRHIQQNYERRLLASSYLTVRLSHGTSRAPPPPTLKGRSILKFYISLFLEYVWRKTEVSLEFDKIKWAINPYPANVENMADS